MMFADHGHTDATEAGQAAANAASGVGDAAASFGEFLAAGGATPVAALVLYLLFKAIFVN